MGAMGRRVARRRKHGTALAGWREGRRGAPVQGVAIGEEALVRMECFLLNTEKEQERGGVRTILLSCGENLLRAEIRLGSVFSWRTPRVRAKRLPDWIFWNRPLSAAGNLVDIGASGGVRGAKYIHYGIFVNLKRTLVPNPQRRSSGTPPALGRFTDRHRGYRAPDSLGLRHRSIARPFPPRWIRA